MPYDMKRLKAPRLAGRSLQLFTTLIESSVLGAPLRSMMAQSLGIPEFRRVPVTEAAVVVPPLPGVADLEGPAAAPPARPLDAAALGALLEIEPAGGGFRFATALGYTRAYREGRTTPEEVAERFLEAVAASDRAEPPLRAFLAVRRDDLLAQARASAARWRENRPISPLDGVPVAVKDEMDQVPFPTTAGTTYMGREPAREDATVVARFRGAGALLVGKTNMHEIGLGITGLNPHHGSARNPYDPTRCTGGSSSGSAAAVAAGLAPIAIGADAGGSIRIPSALCGVVGLKPTFGRVSEHGAVPVCWSVAHIGPIAATARDAALAYGVMAGRDPRDPNTARQPAPRLDGFGERDLGGVRLGVYRDWFRDADTPVVAACERALDALRAAGAQVREIEIPDLGILPMVHAVTVATEMAAARAEDYDRDRTRFGYDVRLTLLLARNLEPTDYVHAQRLRRRICENFARALRDVDAIVTPATAGTAPVLPLDALETGESNFTTLDRMVRFVFAGNLTGLPAIAFPAGYDEGGLPIGMQAIGRPWEEHLLLRLAGAAEAAVPRRPPRVHFRLLEPAPAAVASGP